jgi:hypothetical protein
MFGEFRRNDLMGRHPTPESSFESAPLGLLDSQQISFDLLYGPFPLRFNLTIYYTAT